MINLKHSFLALTSLFLLGTVSMAYGMEDKENKQDNDDPKIHVRPIYNKVSDKYKELKKLTMEQLEEKSLKKIKSLKILSIIEMEEKIKEKRQFLYFVEEKPNFRLEKNKRINEHDPSNLENISPKKLKINYNKNEELIDFPVNISPQTLDILVKTINGDDTEFYKKGQWLVNFFNKFGRKDSYGSGFQPRYIYTKECIQEFNNTTELKKVIEEIVDIRNYIKPNFSQQKALDLQENVVNILNQALFSDNYQLVKNEETRSYVIQRVDKPNQTLQNNNNTNEERKEEEIDIHTYIESVKKNKEAEAIVPSNSSQFNIDLSPKRKENETK